jgi:arylsulfatase A-like enzyme
VPYTPNLQAFADEGIVFARHNTESGQSGTAYASIFTGTHAYAHGVYVHPTRLRPRVSVISEAFADAGYETFYWDGHPMAGARLGYARGVPTQNVSKRTGRTLWLLTPEGALAQSANDAEFSRILNRLNADPSYKAFVQVNFTATHDPFIMYSSPEDRRAFARSHPSEAIDITPEQVEASLAIYKEHWQALAWSHDETLARLDLSDADIEQLVRAVELTYKVAVAKLDHRFGLFIDGIRKRGLMGESLIVFTSDHGEVLYRENALFKWTHGLQLAPEVLSVPLMVLQPGVLGPGRYEGVTRSIDVFPTLLGLAGIAVPPNAALEGVDLGPVLLGEQPPPELRAYSHTTVVPPHVLRQYRDRALVRRFYPRSDPRLIWVRIRDGDRVFKYRNLDGRHWGTEVFDLDTDPGETRNLYSPADPEHQAMRRELLVYKERLTIGFRQGSAVALPEGEIIEALKSLGYIE